MQPGDTIKQSGTHRGRKPLTPGGPPVDRQARWRIIEKFENGRCYCEIRDDNGGVVIGSGDGSEASAKAVCEQRLAQMYGDKIP